MLFYNILFTDVFVDYYRYSFEVLTLGTTSENVIVRSEQRQFLQSFQIDYFRAFKLIIKQEIY